MMKRTSNVESDVTYTQNKEDRRVESQQLMTLPDGKAISDILGEEKMTILQERMKESCHINLADSTAQNLLHYQPLFFTLSLNAMIQIEALKKYPAVLNGNMMDGACIKRAKARGWKVGNLDQQKTSEELTTIKETMTPIDEQVDTLMVLLSNFDERKQKILKYFEGAQNMGDYWTAGDYDGFELKWEDIIIPEHITFVKKLFEREGTPENISDYNKLLPREICANEYYHIAKMLLGD